MDIVKVGAIIGTDKDIKLKVPDFKACKKAGDELQEIFKEITTKYKLTCGFDIIFTIEIEGGPNGSFYLYGAGSKRLFSTITTSSWSKGIKGVKLLNPIPHLKQVKEEKGQIEKFTAVDYSKEISISDYFNFIKTMNRDIGT